MKIADEALMKPGKLHQLFGRLPLRSLMKHPLIGVYQRSASSRGWGISLMNTVQGSTGNSRLRPRPGRRSGV